MARYGTFVEDGVIYVGTADGPLEVGPLSDALDAVGGHSWTISYAEEVTKRHPDLDTSDEGLIIDVVDSIHAMTHSDRFVDTLAAQPTAASSADELSPRLGLFVGKLLENLETGVS